MHAVAHAVGHWDVPVGTLPRQFTSFQGSEKTFEPFGFSLPDPFRVLEAGLLSTLLLRCLKLVLYCLLHQLEGAVIAVLQPVLLGVQELCPGLVS